MCRRLGMRLYHTLFELWFGHTGLLLTTLSLGASGLSVRYRTGSSVPLGSKVPKSATLGLYGLWVIYKRTAMKEGLSPRERINRQLAFYSGAREVLRVRHGRRTEGTFGLRSRHLPPVSPLGRLIPFLRRATWLLAGRETTPSTSRSTRPSRTAYVGPRAACRKVSPSASVRTVVPQYRRRAGPQYPACAFASPAKRVTIGTAPTFPATTAAAARTANCASSSLVMQRCIVAAQVHPPPEISTGIILAASLIATDRFR